MLGIWLYARNLKRIEENAVQIKNGIEFSEQIQKYNCCSQCWQ